MLVALINRCVARQESEKSGKIAKHGFFHTIEKHEIVQFFPAKNDSIHKLCFGIRFLILRQKMILYDKLAELGRKEKN